jgi:hypothetical protein
VAEAGAIVRDQVVSDIAEPAIAAPDQMSRGVVARLPVRHAHGRVDGLSVDVHQFADAEAPALQQPAGGLRVLQPHDHDRRRLPFQEGVDDPRFGILVVVGDADHRLEGRGGERRVNALEHFGEDDVRQRGKHDADELRAGGGQAARRPVGNVAEGLDRLQHAPAGTFGDRRLVSDDARCRDLADIGQPRHIRQGRCLGSEQRVASGSHDRSGGGKS